MSLYDTLKDISDKLIVQNTVKIDHFIFKLHYVWTVTLLLSFSVLLSLSQVGFSLVSGLYYLSPLFVGQYAGDPIDCLVKHGIQQGDSQTFDKYCWVEGTYTKKLALDSADEFRPDVRRFGTSRLTSSPHVYPCSHLQTRSRRT
jgi:hypothetical protein